MNTKERTVTTYELTDDDVMFIDRIIKAKVGKYTLAKVLSSDWSICFDYYVDMFNTLKKVYSRKLHSDKDCAEIRWLLNLLGDVYNGDYSEEDKSKAKELCDIMGKEW